MKARFLYLLVTAVMGLGGMALVYYFIADRTAKLSQDSVVYEPVDLGELKPNEIRKGEVRLRSRSKLAIDLEPPQSTCGCIVLDKSIVQLARLGEAAISFEFRAPSKPGVTFKEIVIRAKEVPEVEWRVPVSGIVVANLWCEPWPLDIEYDNKEGLRGAIIIHHIPGKRIAVKSLKTVKGLGNSLRRVDKDVSAVDLTFDLQSAVAAKSGETVLLISDGSLDSLAVPVSWKPRPKIRFMPETPELSRSSVDGQVLRKKVLVLSRTPGKISAESLVAWAHVEDMQPIKSGSILSIVFDREQLPDDFDLPIVRAIVGKTESALLFVRILR